MASRGSLFSVLLPCLLTVRKNAGYSKMMILFILMIIKNKYGKCNYAFEKDNMGSYVHIYSLFVYPKYRRLGKAKELLQAAIKAIRKNGYDRKIQIVVKPTDNSIDKERLISFYKRMGLEVFDCYSIINQTKCFDDN